MSAFCVEGISIMDPKHGETCGAPFCALCMERWSSEDRTKCSQHLGLEEEAPGAARVQTSRRLMEGFVLCVCAFNFVSATHISFIKPNY